MTLNAIVFQDVYVCVYVCGWESVLWGVCVMFMWEWVICCVWQMVVLHIESMKIDDGRKKKRKRKIRNWKFSIQSFFTSLEMLYFSQKMHWETNHHFCWYFQKIRCWGNYIHFFLYRNQLDFTKNTILGENIHFFNGNQLDLTKTVGIIEFLSFKWFFLSTIMDFDIKPGFFKNMYKIRASPTYKMLGPTIGKKIGSLSSMYSMY